jgi:3-hydroxy-D-aspartate aldolase
MTKKNFSQDSEVGYDIPALPGMLESEVQTPCLLIDMDQFESNLQRMTRILEPFNVSLRAHAKMHKSVDIANQQISLGKSRGICCQKVSEAEVFARAGIQNILLTNQICDPLKIARLVAIAADGCQICVCVDDVENISALDAEARRRNTRLHCLVELDCGVQRCGVSSVEQVVALAKAVKASTALKFDGLQAYQGNVQHELKYHQRRQIMDDVIAKVKVCLEALKTVGIECEIVSGGGTGTFLFEAASGVYTEIQCGSYAFMDADYGQVENLEGQRLDEADWKNALFLLTGVMSTAVDGQAVCDAGLKVQSVDSGLPVIFDRSDISYITCSDEHGIIKDDYNILKINDKLRLIPGHCDPTVNLHDWYVCVRNGRVEDLWPVSARGKSW